MSSAKRLFQRILCKLSGSKQKPSQQQQADQKSATKTASLDRFNLLEQSSLKERRKSRSISKKDFSEQLSELLLLQQQHISRSKEKPTRSSIKPHSPINRIEPQAQVTIQYNSPVSVRSNKRSFSFRRRLQFSQLPQVTVAPTIEKTPQLAKDVSARKSEMPQPRKKGKPVSKKGTSLWKKLMEMCPFCEKQVAVGQGRLMRCMHKAHQECLLKSRGAYCRLCRTSKQPY